MADARLLISDHLGRRVVAIDKPLCTIGRRTTADVYIFSGDVSREHAEIVRDGDRYVLHDRCSRFGTLVNGEPITECTLAPGDRIQLAHNDTVEIIFETDEAPAPRLSESTADSSDLVRMAAILNVLRALGSGRVLSEVLTLVVDSALEVTRADRGFVMLANDQGELEFKIARGRGRTPLPGTSFTTSTKIPRKVFLTGESRLVGDLTDVILEEPHDQTIAGGIRRVMCVPLRVMSMAPAPGQDVRHRVIGVLYLDGHERSAMLSPQTLPSLEAFATQAALAIESARLYAEAAEKARLDRDLRLAAEIQRSLLADPTFAGTTCELSAVSKPCRTVGGDFYDYFELPDGGFAFALGDVAGKGPSAALLAAAVQTNFVAQAAVSDDPAQTMARINAALLRRPVEARFATMFYGVLSADGRLSYCNAGQEPPLVLGCDGLTWWLEAGGPVLGLLSDATYETGIVHLKPDDLLVLCSDGVTEARNAAGEELGRERMVEAIAQCRGRKPEAVLETLLGAVRSFSQGAPQADDITVLILKYRGAGALDQPSRRQE